MMAIRHFWPWSFLPLLLILVGCANLPPLGNTPQAETPLPTEAFSPTLTATGEIEQTLTPATPTVTTTVSQPKSGSFVRIWLLPEFDPEGNSPASGLLKDRLNRFMRENPELRLEIRVKALSGEGGILESLVAANVSAPLALPDLVLLPRSFLESAALKGLLYPYDGLTDAMDDRSWFGYAQQMAHLKNTIYGLPFAGDAMVLAYHPSLIESTPHNLESYLSLGSELLFPAADPQAFFTLGIYLHSGGKLQDSLGRPYLDKTILTNILEFYQRASQAGMMPYWLTQYSNDDQVWEAFTGDQLPAAITWASNYLKYGPEVPEDLAMTSMLTMDGIPYTLANGWSWALAGQDPERRQLSVKLAEYLVEKEFMASWSFAAGYLPTRVDAIQSWQDANQQQLLEQISYSAHLVPSIDLISSLGPAIEQAVVEVLKAESDPQTAAQSAIDQVIQP